MSWDALLADHNIGPPPTFGYWLQHLPACGKDPDVWIRKLEPKPEEKIYNITPIPLPEDEEVKEAKVVAERAVSVIRKEAPEPTGVPDGALADLQNQLYLQALEREKLNILDALKTLEEQLQNYLSLQALERERLALEKYLVELAAVIKKREDEDLLLITLVSQKYYH